MADNQKIREEVQALTDRLETGMQDLYSSDKYAAYLDTLAKFHNYSTRNTMLIHLQMPEATNVAGFNKWKNEFERHVTKGQKGIRIFAPAPFILKKEMDKLDPETQAPMLDADGKAITEEVDITIPAFKAVSVFDVSQTDGKPLPSLAENLTGDVQQYEAFLDSLNDVSAMPIGFGDMKESQDGECNLASRTITIRNGMSEVQTIAAVVHEMTHAELHDYNEQLDLQELEATADIADDTEAASQKPRTRRAEEIEAESVSYVVCQHYGIETGANSFGYIADWSKGRELDELKASLDIIRKTAASMIERIDSRFAEICKDRGIDLSAEQEVTEQEEPTQPLESAEAERINEEPVAEQEPENPAPATTPTRQFFITNRQREQAERMAEKWEARSEAFYAGGDSWGTDTAGYCKTPEEADKAVETAANIRTSINNLLGGSGTWADVQVIRQAVSGRDELDAQVATNQDERNATTPVEPKSAPEQETAQRKNTIPHRNFRALKELASDLVDGKYDYMRSQAGEGFMPLTIEHLYDNRFSMMHYYMQNGEMMRDPDMEFVIDYDAETVNAVYFRQDPLLEQEVLPGQENGRLQRDLNSFLSQWTKNIKGQEYLPEMARFTVRVQDRDHRVFFNPDGKAYQMGIGSLGNGVTIWNRLEEKNGDYATIAHIDADRTVKFYDDNLPDTVKAEIEKTARVSELSAFPKAEVKETAEPVQEEPAPEADNADDKVTSSRYSELQQKGFEIAQRYEKLPLQDRLNMIAETFGCKTAKLVTSPCGGKWRGTSDISIIFDNGSSLGVGNYRTPEAKTVKAQNECVNNTLARYNKEIVSEKIELATAALSKREVEDNAVAAEKGLKPYTFLNVELNDGSDPKSGGYMGWYYVTLAVDEKIIALVETGLSSDIDRGVTSEHINSEKNYFIAGSLKENDVDFVFNNVAFASEKTSYQLHLSDNVRERAEQKLSEQSADKTVGINDEQDKPDIIMPDPAIDVSERDLFGYSYEGMLPLLQERALELFDQDYGIYLLYPDNTEGAVFDRDEIENHDGIFGIELADWQASQEFEQMKAAVKESEASKEVGLLYGKDATYAIYQLRDGDETRDFRFESLDRLESRGLDVDRNNYNLVYSAPLSDGDTLDTLYAKFNVDHPEDFTGHSLSMSDVVVIQQDGNAIAHYVDSIGFSELPDFFNEKAQPEKPLPEAKQQDSDQVTSVDVSAPQQPTVAELEEQVNAGKQISLLDLSRAIKTEQAQKDTDKPQTGRTLDKKPSILAQLQAAKKESAQGQNQPKNAPKRNSEMEV